MHIAVYIKNEKTCDLLLELFRTYEEENGYPIKYSLFRSDTDLVCNFMGGEYDAIFFHDIHYGNLTDELREKDRRVRLVRIAPINTVLLHSEDVWYCLAEPLNRTFVFPVLNRLKEDTEQQLEAGLLIKSRGSIMQLAFSRIEYAEVMGRTVFFYLIDGTTEEVLGTFSDFENRLLNWPDFVKVHRAFIINLRYVQKLESSGILTSSGHSVPISKHLYAQFKKAYLCHMLDSETKTEGLESSHRIEKADAKVGYSVLLVDDEETERLHWSQVLMAHGCTIQTADNGETALQIANQEHYDCVVLDVKLGDECGFDLCAVLAEKTGAPVIFLSSLDDSESQTQGFLSGGIDYITKDSTDALFWLKIETRIKMSRAGKVELKSGELKMNLQQRKVFLAEQEVNLTVVEFELLSLMMQNPNVVFAPTRLYEVIWGAKQWDGGQGIQLHLSLLSRKLVNIFKRHSFIETVWGSGYRFVPMQEDKEAVHE